MEKERLQRALEGLSATDRSFILDLLKRDPIGFIYGRGLALYAVLMVVLLLWPFDFFLPFQPNSAHWIGGSNGIAFPGKGQLLEADAEHLGRDDCFLSGTGLTVETWVTPFNTDQTGPARIVSYSKDTGQRNFTLGQNGRELVFRLRTENTDANGTRHQMTVRDVFGSSGPIHIAVTYDFHREAVYVNGRLRADRPLPGGRFHNWDPSHRLVIGNEVTGNRPWLGEIYLMALYKRPLTAIEVLQNYQAGWKARGGRPTGRVVAGLAVEHLFAEGKGNVAKDSSTNCIAVDLHLPQWIGTKAERGPFQKGYLGGGVSDPLLNILIFMPIGFLLAGRMRIRRGRDYGKAVTVFVLGTLFTVAIEAIQFFILSRTSSLLDILMNAVGVLLGILFFEMYKGRLERVV